MGRANEGDLNGDAYVKILKKAKPDFKRLAEQEPEWTFQHDGASAHKDRKANEWLEENVPNHITSGPKGEWPANSPDLNIVDNVWGILEDNAPTSLYALKRRLINEWNALEQDTLRDMAGGMKKRLQGVVAGKGKCIGK